MPDLPAPDEVADMPTDPDLIAALDQLSPDQREVIVLRFVADLSLEQVAEVTKRRVGAVKALQHRADAAFTYVGRIPRGLIDAYSFDDRTWGRRAQK